MKQANIKILRRGDQVINVWGDGAAIRVAVRHKNGEVDLYLLTPDEQGLPRISSDRCRITFGDNEVEIISETPETRSPRSSRNSRSAPPVKICRRMPFRLHRIVAGRIPGLMVTRS